MRISRPTTNSHILQKDIKKMSFREMFYTFAKI